MSTRISRLPSTLLVAALIAFTGHVGTADERVVSCGDTLGPGGEVTFAGDVGPCTAATDPALRIVGSVKVDMAGHRLLCDGGNFPTIGIRLEGKGVKLSRGSVHECGVGIEVGGEGGHKLDALVVTDSDDHGFSVTSDKNKLTRLGATANGDTGFSVRGDGNKLKDTLAVANRDHGYEFRNGADGNKLERAAATGNRNDGIKLAGDTAKVKDCVTADNGDDGFDVEGDGNAIQKCHASANGDGNDPGINLEGDRNQVKKNLSLDNTAFGIRAQDGAQENVISNNVAFGHRVGVNGAGFDLRDENAGGTCDANRWTKNVFGSSEAGGVEGPACIQ